MGPGLLESVYKAVSIYELEQSGLSVKFEQAIPVVYETVKLDLGFRADIVVENKVVVEVKSVEALAPVHGKQLLTYLRLMDKRLGLLINFNVDLIKDGIKRVPTDCKVKKITQRRKERQKFKDKKKKVEY